MKEFNSLNDWQEAVKKANLPITKLQPTDPEDPLDHYFAGSDDALNYFLDTGGTLLFNSGYCTVEGTIDPCVNGQLKAK